jgi:ATP-binding cassette subfamily F protein uup
MEGDGRATVYAGGWSDMLIQRGDAPAGGSAPKREGRQAAAPARPAPASAAKTRPLSFVEEKRLTALPGEIEALEADVAKLEAMLADTGLYARDPARFDKATRALAQRRAALAKAEEAWLALEARREEAAAT